MSNEYTIEDYEQQNRELAQELNKMCDAALEDQIKLSQLQQLLSEKEKQLEYWKQLAEAAEQVMKVMDIPKNKSGLNTVAGRGNEQFQLFGERNHKWQQLKQSPIN